MRQTLELWAEPSLARHDEANDPHLVMARSDLQTRNSIRIASRIGQAATHNARVRVAGCGHRCTDAAASVAVRVTERCGIGTHAFREHPTAMPHLVINFLAGDHIKWSVYVSMAADLD